MKTFVVAFNIFTLLIYIIFAFTGPTSTDQRPGPLFDFYTVIMILEIVALIILFCQIVSGGRRIADQNEQLGKAIKLEGYIMLVANVCGAVGYFLLSHGTLIFGHLSFFPCLICMLLFFGLTETLPMYGFVQMQNKLVEIEFGEAEQEVQVADQPAAADD